MIIDHTPPEQDGTCVALVRWDDGTEGTTVIHVVTAGWQMSMTGVGGGVSVVEKSNKEQPE